MIQRGEAEMRMRPTFLLHKSRSDSRAGEKKARRESR